MIVPREDLDHIAKGLEPLKGLLRNKKIFITGGTGFFGKWLLAGLCHLEKEWKLNLKIVVLSRNPEIFQEENTEFSLKTFISFIEGDIRKFAFPNARFDYIIHGATSSNVAIQDSNPMEMLDTIVFGGKHILDFAEKCSAKKVLNISSGAVYGKQPTDTLNIQEDSQLPIATDLNETNCYGEGKRIVELMMNSFIQRIDVEIVNARCFAFVGPHLPLDSYFAIGNFIRDGLNGNPISISGDGTPRRSYLYAADLVVWLLTILLKGKSGESYNVGSGESLSIKEIADKVAQAFPDSEVNITTEPDTKAKISRYVPSVKKAKEELNLDTEISLKEAIEKTIAWHQNASANI